MSGTQRSRNAQAEASETPAGLPHGVPATPESVEEAFGGQPPADAPGVQRNPDGTINQPPISLARATATTEGWEVGNVAAEDRYVAVNGRGEPTGKVSKTPVKGYGRQIVAKGDVVTQAVLDQLDALES